MCKGDSSKMSVNPTIWTLEIFRRLITQKGSSYKIINDKFVVFSTLSKIMFTTSLSISRCADEERP